MRKATDPFVHRATEMAARFPHTEVQGIDLAPAPLDPALVPANLQFSVDDINNGLEHLYGQFDLVHSRCIMTGISDPEKTISELQMCLKPGGLLLIIEGDKELLHEDRTTTVKMARVDGDEDVSGVSEEGSWFERSIWGTRFVPRTIPDPNSSLEAHEASKIAGSALERGVEMIDMGLWDQPMCDPETAGACSIYIPIGPWPKCKYALSPFAFGADMSHSRRICRFPCCKICWRPYETKLSEGASCLSRDSSQAWHGSTNLR